MINDFNKIQSKTNFYENKILKIYKQNQFFHIDHITSTSGQGTSTRNLS